MDFSAILYEHKNHLLYLQGPSKQSMVVKTLSEIFFYQYKGGTCTSLRKKHLPQVWVNIHHNKGRRTPLQLHTRHGVMERREYIKIRKYILGDPYKPGTSPIKRYFQLSTGIISHETLQFSWDRVGIFKYLCNGSVRVVSDRLYQKENTPQ